MIKLDPGKFSIQIVQLKKVSLALGGSISIVDEELTVGKKEVVKRIKVPTATARAFLMATNKTASYIKPLLVAVVRYSDHIIAMEPHPLGPNGVLEQDFGGGTIHRWQPFCEVHIANTFRHLNKPGGRDGRSWYFDGRYAYAFDYNDSDVAVRAGRHLTQDGKFRSVSAMTLDTQQLSHKDGVVEVPRQCLAFVPNKGTPAISPPIWKRLSDVGASQLGKTMLAKMVGESDDDGDVDFIEPDEEAENTFNFDAIDEKLAVNLSFALKAGVEVGRVFGFETIEPLSLPRLMIELRTVNLPNVSKEIKQTYDIGLQFTHAIAWLLGLSRRANTLETFIMVRSLLKYISKRGIFRTNAFAAGAVFKEGMSADHIQTVDLSALMQGDIKQLHLSGQISDALAAFRTRRDQPLEHSLDDDI